MSQSGTKANNEDEKTDAEKSNTDEENKSKLIEHSVEKAIEQYRKIREIPDVELTENCLLYTSPSPRDGLLSRMPSSA